MKARSSNDMKDNRGYLLVEALTALALLAVGVCAVSDAFAQSRAAMRRGALLARLAACVEEKFTAGAAADCDEWVLWRQRLEPVSSRVERVTLTAFWKENEIEREQTFETVQRF